MSHDAPVMMNSMQSLGFPFWDTQGGDPFMITWENIGLTNGWSVRSGGSFAARAGLTEDGSFVAVAGEITHSPTTSTNPFEGNPIGTLPVKAPAKAQDVPVVVTTKSTITSASLYVTTNGNLTLYGLPQGTETVAFSALIPAG